MAISKINDFYNIKFNLEAESLKYVVKKGSIAVNGISLTVAEIINSSIVVAVIPHTFENTSLKLLKVDDYVNIETDILSKYVEKFLSTGDNNNITVNFLAENGFC